MNDRTAYVTGPTWRQQDRTKAAFAHTKNIPLWTISDEDSLICLDAEELKGSIEWTAIRPAPGHRSLAYLRADRPADRNPAAAQKVARAHPAHAAEVVAAGVAEDDDHTRFRRPVHEKHL